MHDGSCPWSWSILACYTVPSTKYGLALKLYDPRHNCDVREGMISVRLGLSDASAALSLSHGSQRRSLERPALCRHVRHKYSGPPESQSSFPAVPAGGPSPNPEDRSVVVGRAGRRSKSGGYVLFATVSMEITSHCSACFSSLDGSFSYPNALLEPKHGSDGWEFKAHRLFHWPSTRVGATAGHSLTAGAILRTSLVRPPRLLHAQPPLLLYLERAAMIDCARVPQEGKRK